MKNRKEVLQELSKVQEFDVIIIGGGASGIGAALEAALRGYSTLLLEKYDFTKGTSSKSTKLIHGGVRYLAQGDIRMVREALKERGYLVRNAPHLVHDQPFIIPGYRWWEGAFYTLGLTFYDLLAGRLSMGRSIRLGRNEVLNKLPGIREKGLRGGVLYHDGQFDDSRLAIDLLHAFFEQGGLAVNYLGVTGLDKDLSGKVCGVHALDSINHTSHTFRARAVINATGVWADDILAMDNRKHERTIRPSQGIHIVIKKDFLPGNHALMIPRTSDGRVLFAVPWHDHLVVGTTDTPVSTNSAEPAPLDEEVAFLLETASGYLTRPVERADVLSVFTGLRPLAAPSGEGSGTKEISRNHKVIVSDSKLITVIGGKWTTYRKMAQDLIDTAARLGLLVPSTSNSRHYRIHEADTEKVRDALLIYGKNAPEIRNLMQSDLLLSGRLHPDLPYTWAEMEWCGRNEMVVHLEDLLARRTRALFLNARATREIAGTVAGRMAPLLGWSGEQEKQEVMEFLKLSDNYILH